MIDCYCKVCGLFISIPDEYAGGSGDCPRCRTQLRIPIPVSRENSKYKKNLRYMVLTSEQRLNEDLPTLCDDSYGSSNRYRCSNCGQLYESINVPPHKAGQCPACQTINEPAICDVKFARAYSTGNETKEDLPDTVDEDVQLEDGYLLLEPRSKSEIKENDIIIDGIPIVGEEDDTEPAPKEEPTPEPSEPQPVPVPVPVPIPAASATHAGRASHPLDKARTQTSADAVPADMNIQPGQWAYFIRGKAHGPISTEELRKKFITSELSQAVLVWKPGIEGFQAADRFEELHVEMDHEQIVAQPIIREDDSVSTLKMWSKRIQSLLWMSVVVWAAFIVVIAIRQPLQALGQTFFRALMVIVMAGGIAGVAISGTLLRSPKVLLKTGSTTSTKWFISLAGFILVLVACFFSITNVEPPKLFQNQELYESLAGSGFNAIHAKDISATMNKVNWDDFTMNGKMVGSEIKKQKRETDKRVVILAAIDYMNKLAMPKKPTPATQPTTAPATKPAAKPKKHKFDWEVMSQTVDKTIVRSKAPNGKWIIITIQGEMITSVDIK